MRITLAVTRIGSSPNASCKAEPLPVVVLLSTFNGAAFLIPQIESILGQTWPNLRLVIRDDGSSDGTWRLLRAWRNDPRVLVFRGRNMGPKNSFLRMLGLVDARTELVAFADQDDMWQPEKIERGVLALTAEREMRPVLYCSRSFLTDRTLHVTGLTPCWPEPPSFGNALVENIATGCTILLNRSAVALLKSAGSPAGAIMHDWWSYLVISAFGDVIFDPRPSVLLRQHGMNLVGVSASRRGRWAKKVTRQLRQDSLRMIVGQARSFLSHFGDHPMLGGDHRCLACDLVRGSGLERRVLAVDKRLHRQFALDDVLLRCRVLAGPWPGAPDCDRYA